MSGRDKANRNQLITMSDERNCDWRTDILTQLRARRAREYEPFVDVFRHCMKLSDGFDSLKNENAQLSLQKDNLQKELLKSGPLSGQDGLQDNSASPIHKPQSAATAALVNDKAALEKKVYQLQEELTELHRRKGESATRLVELQSQVEEKSKSIKSLTSRLDDMRVEVSASKSACQALERTIIKMSEDQKVLKDEHEALQIAYNTLRNRYLELEKDKAELMTRYMAEKAKQVERMNAENEVAQLKKSELMRKQLEDATREMIPNEQAPPGSLPQDEQPVLCVLSRLPKRKLFSIEAHEGEVNALAWYKTSTLLSGGGDRKVKQWEVTYTGATPKGQLAGSNAGITSLDVDSDMDFLLGSSNDYASRVWSLSDQRLKRTLTGHGSKVSSAKFLKGASSDKVVTGSHDRTLKIWDLNRHACIKTLFAGSICNDLVALTGHRTTVASGHFDKKIRFWDTRMDNNESSANEITLAGKITSLDVSTDTNMLLSCVRDDSLKLFDIRMNQIVHTFTSDGFRVGCDYTRTKISPDGQYVACGSSDGSVFVWNALSGRLETCLQGEHVCNVIVVSWAPKGNIFVSCDSKKKAVFWSD